MQIIKKKTPKSKPNIMLWIRFWEKNLLDFKLLAKAHRFGSNH
jgi:hypothetical protein